MKILYIGDLQTYKQYKRGIVPSHWLYGACEMEADGNEVIWEQESIDLFNDWNLIKQYKPDMVFIPNLNMRAHIMLSIFVVLGICKIPVYGYLHHTPKGGKASILYKLFLNGLKHIFFLSSKTMEETCERGYASREKCSVPIWGPDMDFYNKVKTSDGEWFVSTGKENRDFDILIEAFKRTGAPLKIMTAKSHAGSNYEDLEEKCKDIPNIQVILTENTGDVFPLMLEAMANAKALVCPLKQDKLNYCVGLSTIADAIGLNKPLIITKNPYHDKEYIEDYYQVEKLEEWVEAIQNISNRKITFQQDCQILSVNKNIHANIVQCYINMKSIISI